eukprot:TRINITY_DN1939_c0_g3_i2.p1 TRINITY_DN1939_c0_g3~~TRINITY_DN1939_c0_g3_i2.p1  ORF type:complete len:474 (+),score=140.52 TRINITY_DN1939_c0_g3_i2:100-1422(+)
MAAPSGCRRSAGAPFSSLKSRSRGGRKPVDALSVSTPWFPDGISKQDVTLEAEVAAVAPLLALTPSEARARAEAVACVAAAAAAQWGPQVTIVPYGSYASGLSAPGSAVDLAVGRCGEAAVTEESIASLAAAVPGARLVAHMADGTGNGFAQVRVPGGAVSLNISFRAADAAHERRSAAAVSKLLAELPHAATAHRVLRQMLAQCGTLDVAKGGMSAYALLVVIANVMRRDPAAACSPASAVLAVCRQHGAQAGPAGAVIARDLLDPSCNLMAGCMKEFAIRTQLQHCFSSFMRWESGALCSKAADCGYRGRTPLSGVLSHQTLWPRREALRRELQQQQPVDGSRGSHTAPTSPPPTPGGGSDNGMTDSPQSLAATAALPQVMSEMSLESMHLAAHCGGSQSCDSDPSDDDDDDDDDGEMPQLLEGDDAALCQEGDEAGW